MLDQTARPDVTSFFHKDTSTICHVVADPATGRCAIVDPVLDFDQASGRTSTAFADRIIAHVREHGLNVDWILETHAHADHLTAAPCLKAALGGRIGIGAHIRAVQDSFGKAFNEADAFRRDGSQFDHLFTDGETFRIGDSPARVIHTPGHTPACVTYLIGDAGFVGDTLFMPDGGTARCDFPGGDAATLYRSIRKIFALPDATRLFMCHDYGPGGRDYRWETTVGEEKRANIHVGGGAGEAAFVRMRSERDATLSMPRLILPAIQLNMRAGAFPPPESNGVSYLKLPLDLL